MPAHHPRRSVAFMDPLVGVVGALLLPRPGSGRAARVLPLDAQAVDSGVLGRSGLVEAELTTVVNEALGVDTGPAAVGAPQVADRVASAVAADEHRTSGLQRLGVHDPPPRIMRATARAEAS
jgi:hypothetical protein